ncbi:MAG: tetratricopeptide repeat protein [Phycisphaerales bacterium]
MLDDTGTASPHTLDGQIIGTLQYMSPEQVAGETSGADTRSDVYALGVILYELLTDRPPYEVTGKGLLEAARVIREQEPSRLSTFDRDLRGDLDVIVGKALERDRERRYPSVAALADDIERYLRDEPIVARPSSAWYVLRKFTRRNRGAVIGGSAVVATLLLAGAGVTWQAIRATNARNDAIKAQTGEAEQLERARKEQKEAQDRAAEAEAVIDLLKGMFQSVEGGKGGPSVTVLDSLGFAAKMLDANPSTQPSVWYPLRLAIVEGYLALSAVEPTEEQLRIIFDRAKRDAPRSDKYLPPALVSLAILKYGFGDYRAAVEAAQDAIARPQSGPDAPMTRARAHLVLASSCMALGEQARASEPLSEAEQIVAHLPAGNIDLAVRVHQLRARLLMETGRPREARELIMSTLEKAREVCGDAHPNTLLLLDVLQGIERGAGNLQRAFELSEEVLRGRLAIWGERYSYTMAAMSNHATSLLDVGRNAEAEQLLLRLLPLEVTHFGPDHPSTLVVKNALCVLYTSLRRFDEAVPMGEQALEGRRRALGPDHEATMTAAVNLARAYAGGGRVDEALREVDSVIERREATLGPRHVSTFRAKAARGELLTQGRRLEESERHLRRRNEEASDGLTPTDPLRIRIRCLYAGCLTRLARWEEAESELFTARRSLESLPGADARSQIVRKHLHNLYVTWNKPEKAAEFAPPSEQPSKS